MASKYEQALDAVEREKKKNKTLRARAEEATQKVLGKGLVMAGSAGAAVLDAKYPDKKLGGLPLPLLIGAVAEAVDLAGLAGKASSYVGNVGDGMIGSVVYVKVKEKMQQQSSTAGTDYVGAGWGNDAKRMRGGQTITTDEVLRQLERVA